MLGIKPEGTPQPHAVPQRTGWNQCNQGLAHSIRCYDQKPQNLNGSANKEIVQFCAMEGSRHSSIRRWMADSDIFCG
jgi:hypothetical protein